jgi:hypothetical protein
MVWWHPTHAEVIMYFWRMSSSAAGCCSCIKILHQELRFKEITDKIGICQVLYSKSISKFVEIFKVY